MKILIILFFNSDLGGLHDNVFAIAREGRKKGYDINVACRNGPFKKQLESEGIKTIEIRQDKKIISVNNIIKEIGTDIDLIHAHPGVSREIALLLHDDHEIPVIYHVHGAWNDSIHHYMDKLASVFVVSDSVKQSIINVSKNSSYKVHILPNYSDYESAYNHSSIKENEEIVISLVSRLEKDKKNIIDEVKNLIDYFENTSEKIIFNIIGEGSLKAELEKYIKVHLYNKHIKVNFIGWVSDKNLLKNYMLKSDILIGPGRVAIDAYTLGKPIIVIGSKNYYGAIDKNNWQYFVSSNFGGIGPKLSSKDSIIEDIKELLNNKEHYKESIDIGKRVVETFYNKEKTLEKMFNIYEIILKRNKL